jgi:iron complex outermembrane recepter protein
MAASLVRRSVRLVLGALLALTPLATLAAQSGTVQGKVTDSTGAALAGANVIVDRTTLRVTTATSGRYVFHGVPTGTQTIRVRAIGYTAASADVKVAGGDVIEQDFVLTRSPVELAPIDVVVGSRGQHTAAQELAVPVDVYTTEQLQQQGTTETGQILAALSPSVNFPTQSITDANDIVRPFTLRGLSPDHTLVLINGWRQHQTALLNTFPYGSGAGSSGVDLNAIPGSAIDRIEVLRDGASAQYGSDAIAGVVNLVMKEGKFTPFLNADAGYYVTKDYPDDGTRVNLNGGWGFNVGRGTLALFGEYQHANPTNRAWADPSAQTATTLPDSVDPSNGHVVHKNNPVPQPNLHWGDGLEKDILTFGNFRMPLNQTGSTEFYAFGGYSNRDGTGNAFFRSFDSERNWQELYPLGFLPQFHPNVNDYSFTGGIRTGVSGWAVDFGGSYGYNKFEYRMEHTNNASLGPCLDTPCAPGPDGALGTPDDIDLTNQLSFNAGDLKRTEALAGLNFSKALKVGLPKPLNVAIGAAYRHETYQIIAGDSASWINGGHLAQDSVANPGTLAPAGSSGFPGFAPTDASNNNRNNFGTYLDLETNLSQQLLVNVAGRYENYSDFGDRVTGKAAVRFQPTKRFVLRGAANTGFRAPGLPQSFFSHTTTNFIGGQLVEVGNFPVDNHASKVFGAKPLKEETSYNFSAGFAVSPKDNLTFTVDYYHIKINDRILLGATFDGSADPVVAQVLVDSGITNVSAVQFFTNGLDTKTDGVDITGNWLVPAGATGTLNFNAVVNYTANKITRVDPLPPVLQGTATTYTSILDLVTTLAIEKERPDWRGTLTTSYLNGRFHGLVRGMYYGKFESAEPSFTDAEKYSGKALADAEVGFRFNQVDLSLGCRNLFDTYPDKMQSPNNNNGNTLPWAAASPFGYNGRYIYTRAQMVLGW